MGVSCNTECVIFSPPVVAPTAVPHPPPLHITTETKYSATINLLHWDGPQPQPTRSVASSRKSDTVRTLEKLITLILDLLS